MKLTKIQKNLLLTQVAVACQRALAKINGSSSGTTLDSYVCPPAIRRKITRANGLTNWNAVAALCNITPSKAFKALPKNKLLDMIMGTGRRPAKITAIATALRTKHEALVYGEPDSVRPRRVAPRALENKRQRVIDLMLKAQDAVAFNAADTRVIVGLAIKKINQIAK